MKRRREKLSKWKARRKWFSAIHVRGIVHGGKTTVKECIKNSCTASGCRAQFLDRTARHGKKGNVQAEKRVELKKIVLEYYSDSDS